MSLIHILIVLGTLWSLWFVDVRMAVRAQRIV